LPTTNPECTKLTVRGIEQAKYIADYLKSHISLDFIVTSRYKRTHETAAFTNPFFTSVPLTQWEVQEFTYLSSIHREQSTIADRKLLVDAYWEQCLPNYVDGPGSESFEAFVKRVRAFLAQLQSTEFKSAETIATFSHQQFKTALSWLIKHNPTEMTQHSWRFKRVTEHLEQPVSVQREWVWA
jgi:probable phosphoglycerate mutase